MHERDSKTCRHRYDQKRFAACPYCHPPAYAEFQGSRIRSFHLSASAIAGSFQHVAYHDGALSFTQGFQGKKISEKTIPFSGEAFERLSEALIACHIETWRSNDGSRPMSLGRSAPQIEITFENGSTICWFDEEPPDRTALARVEAILSAALGLDFHLADRTPFPRPTPERRKPDKPRPAAPKPVPAEQAERTQALLPGEAEAEKFLRELVSLRAPGVALAVIPPALGLIALVAGLWIDLPALGGPGAALLLCGLVVDLLLLSRSLRMRRCVERLYTLGLARQAAAQLSAVELPRWTPRLKDNPCVYTADFLFVPGAGTLLSLADIQEYHVTDNRIGSLRSTHGVKVHTTTINVLTFSGMRMPLGAVDAATFTKAVKSRGR